MLWTQLTTSDCLAKWRRKKSVHTEYLELISTQCTINSYEQCDNEWTSRWRATIKGPTNLWIHWVLLRTACSCETVWVLQCPNGASVGPVPASIYEYKKILTSSQTNALPFGTTPVGSLHSMQTSFSWAQSRFSGSETATWSQASGEIFPRSSLTSC